MNATIDTAVQKLLAQARDSVLATPGETAIVASIYYVNGSGTLNTRWMSLQLAFTVAADTVLNLYQEVTIDMSDGHGVTIVGSVYDARPSPLRLCRVRPRSSCRRLPSETC